MSGMRVVIVKCDGCGGSMGEVLIRGGMSVNGGAHDFCDQNCRDKFYAQRGRTRGPES